MIHNRTYSLLATTLLTLTSIQAAPQDGTEIKAEKAAAAADAILKKLPSIPGMADAKVINIHIGDNLTFGFDEGIDAEEWGMTENNNDPAAAGANPAKPGAKPNPEKPQGFRKIDFRKGDLVLIASEEPVKAADQASQPEPAPSQAAPTEPAPATAP
jgi:hypothetical protein